MYNVGYGKSFSVEEVINIISNVIDKRVDKKIIRKNEVLDCIASIDKVQNSFNWKPQYSLERYVSFQPQGMVKIYKYLSFSPKSF